MATGGNVIFFKIGKTKTGKTSLQDLLDKLAPLKIDARVKELESGVSVVLDRIEPIVEAGSKVYVGQVGRLQDTNFPPQYEAGKVNPLGVKGDLLHAVAFLYDPAINVLCIESDNKTVSPNRFFEYLRNLENDFNGALNVILDRDKIGNIEKETPKSLTIAVAKPSVAVGLNQGTQNFLSLLTQACEQFDGVKIEVTIQASRSPKNHLNNLMAPIKGLLSGAATGDIDLKKLEAKTVEGRIENDGYPYDLLGQILRHKEDDLKLPKDNPGKSYTLRSQFVRRAYMNNRPYLKAYGG